MQAPDDPNRAMAHHSSTKRLTATMRGPHHLAAGALLRRLLRSIALIGLIPTTAVAAELLRGVSSLPLQGGPPAHRPATGRPAKGKFLVAKESLRDPNFARTVVLLLHYDERGAIGVVINRPTDVKLSQVLDEVEELRERKEVIHIGGPVARNGVVFLIRTNRDLPDAAPIFGEVRATGSVTALRTALRDPGEVRLRAYAGHAGWGPNQLDSEIATGGWYVVPAEADAIFELPASRVWEEMIDRAASVWAGGTDGGLHAASWRERARAASQGAAERRGAAGFRTCGVKRTACGASRERSARTEAPSCQAPPRRHPVDTKRLN